MSADLEFQVLHNNVAQGSQDSEEIQWPELLSLLWQMQTHYGFFPYDFVHKKWDTSQSIQNDQIYLLWKQTITDLPLPMEVFPYRLCNTKRCKYTKAKLMFKRVGSIHANMDPDWQSAEDCKNSLDKLILGIVSLLYYCQ